MPFDAKDYGSFDCACPASSRVEVFTMSTASAAVSERSAPLRYDARALAAALADLAPSVAIGNPQPGLYADRTRDPDETAAAAEGDGTPAGTASKRPPHRPPRTSAPHITMNARSRKGTKGVADK